VNSAYTLGPLSIAPGAKARRTVGEGAVILREMRPDEATERLGEGQSVTIRLEDVDTHYKGARSHGARSRTTQFLNRTASGTHCYCSHTLLP
jgi:hypothetical protein